MPLSTEVFVMAIFIAGSPLFYFMLRDSEIKGNRYFIFTYISLTLSNIFTVVEEFWLNTFFNFCEHLFITVAAIMLLIAISELTTKQSPKNIPWTSPINSG